MRPGITAVVTSIPTRNNDHLVKALGSVFSQTKPVDALVVVVDNAKQGAAINRDNGVAMVQTEWVAFLDDDDWWYPNHIEVLAAAAEESGADYIHPHYDVIGGTDPFPMFEGRQFDIADPHQIPITVLARTEVIRAVGGYSEMPDNLGPDDPGLVDPTGVRSGEDWRLTLRLGAAGYKFHHIPQRTWCWRHWAGNTAGLPSRWGQVGR